MIFCGSIDICQRLVFPFRNLRDYISGKLLVSGIVSLISKLYIFYKRYEILMKLVIRDILDGLLGNSKNVIMNFF